MLADTKIKASFLHETRDIVLGDTLIQLIRTFGWAIDLMERDLG